MRRTLLLFASLKYSSFYQQTYSTFKRTYTYEYTCFAPFYPRVFGGELGDTTFNAIDIDDAGNFIAGGRSTDTSIVTVASPIVVFITSENQHKWAKQLQGTYDYVNAAKFNPSGTRAVVSLDKGPLFLLLINSNDGSIINSLRDSQSKLELIENEGILFSGDNHLYLGINRVDNNFSILKTEALATGDWTQNFYFYRDDMGSKSFTLAFGRNNEIFFVGEYYKFHGTNDYFRVIMAFNPVDGSYFWQFNNHHAEPLDALYYFKRLAYSSTDNHLFGCSENTSTTTAKIQITRFTISNTDDFEAPAFHNYEYGNANEILRCLGMFAQNMNDVAFLIYEQSTGRHSYARADFSLPESATIQVTEIGPFSDTNNLMSQALFQAIDQAFYVGSVKQIETNVFTAKVGYLMSYEIAKSCLTLTYTPQTEAFDYLPTEQFYYHSGWILNSEDSVIESVITNQEDLDLNNLVDHSPCGPLGVTATAQDDITHTVESLEQSYPITPFTLDFQCSNVVPITYLLTLQGGGQLPQEIELVGSDIVISYPQTALENDLVFEMELKGTLPNESTNTALFKITVQGCSVATLSPSAAIPYTLYKIGYPSKQLDFQQFEPSLPDCQVGYELEDTDQQDLQYDIDVFTFSGGVQSVVIETEELGKMREYNLRVRGTVTSSQNSNSFAFTVLVDDPCKHTEVLAHEITDYSYDVALPTHDTVAQLSWTQTEQGCPAIEYKYTMGDQSDIDPLIFEAKEGTLYIQSSDIGAVGDYPIQLQANVPGYPLAEVTKFFSVDIYNTCSQPSITPATINGHQYIVHIDELKVDFDSYQQVPSYCTFKFSYKATLANNQPLPDFIKFDSAQRTFTVHTTDNDLSGTYQIRVTASLIDLPQAKDNSVVWNLVVLANRFKIYENSAPYFDTQLKDMRLGAKEFVQYRLPPIKDFESDKVNVKVSLGSALTFVTYEKDHFKINPSPKDAGVHTVKIQLVDVNEIPKTSEYQMTIEILPIKEDDSQTQDSSDVESDKNNINNGQLKAWIESISLDGVLLIKFNQELQFQAGYASYDEKTLKLSVDSGVHLERTQQRFEWQITKWGKKEISIKITFENPLEVSSQSQKDTLSIEFIQNKYFYAVESGQGIKQNTIIQKQLPQLLKDDRKWFRFGNSYLAISKALLDSGEALKRGIEGIIYGNMIINLVLQAQITANFQQIEVSADALGHDQCHVVDCPPAPAQHQHDRELLIFFLAHSRYCKVQRFFAWLKQE